MESAIPGFSLHICFIFLSADQPSLPWYTGQQNTPFPSYPTKTQALDPQFEQQQRLTSISES